MEENALNDLLSLPKPRNEPRIKLIILINFPFCILNFGHLKLFRI